MSDSQITKTLTLRKSLKGNWGIFERRIVSFGTYVRYPKCACPQCTGIYHGKIETMYREDWVALYVNPDRNNVIQYAKLLTVCNLVDEAGIPVK